MPTDRSAHFQDHFSAHAAAYASARPTYPQTLFAWLSTQAPGHTLAWDCATGNGQAAIALAEHFDNVLATDASGEQLRHAMAHPQVGYRLATAEAPELAPKSVDLITVAQAVHWFDRPRFYVAAQQVLRPGGLIAVWAYGLFTVAPDIDRLIADFYERIIGPYWPPERSLIDEDYRTLDFPFPPLTVPAFHMRHLWTLEQVLAYLHTWSAVNRYRRKRGTDPLASIEDELGRLWGRTRKRVVHWPLHLRAGQAR